MNNTSLTEIVMDFWDSRPCNVRHSNKELGTREYFEEVEKRRYFVEPHILTFAEFEKWEGKTVLEIGCGIGTDAVSFARSGAKYTGVELSGASLGISIQRFEILNLEGDFFRANCEHLTDLFKGRTFDLIYSFGVLHHTPNIYRALREIRDLCHAQTKIKLMLYAKNSWKQMMIDEGLDQPEAQSGCPIANSYTKEEVHELLAESGLKISQISQYHIFPYKIAEYREYKYEKESWFREMPENIFAILQRNLGWHLLIDAELA